MAQTKEGAEKCAARKCGIHVDEYRIRVQRGEKHCHRCRIWKPVDFFGSDSTRYDGVSAVCSDCRRERAKAMYVKVGRVSRKGHRLVAIRDGDKLQARARVNLLVKIGRLENPNKLPCYDCGHRDNDRRHEYDHFAGYASDKQECVQAVCTLCHKKRDCKRANATHCIHGHEFTKENTIITKSGHRKCRECFRIYDRGRRDAAFWREYRLKRKDSTNG